MDHQYVAAVTDRRKLRTNPPEIRSRSQYAPLYSLPFPPVKVVRSTAETRIDSLWGLAYPTGVVMP